MRTASPKPVTRYCPLVHAGTRTILGEQIAKAHDLTRRCIGPTGSIGLSETPVDRWSHKQKDRLAAVSPKSD